MSDTPVVDEKTKRGRKPKPQAEKCTEMLCMHMWEDEYELFTEAAKPGTMAAFLREAVHELISSRVKSIDAPRPVTRGLGAQFTLLMTEQEKIDLDKAASKRFDLPLSGLVRAAGLRKIKQRG